MSKAGLVFDQCNLYELMQVPTVAHRGDGSIRFARILTAHAISGACNFMDFTTMPPGTTIGLHAHSAEEEEYYLVLAGAGTMVIGDRSFTVKAGDLIRNPPGSAHSLANDSAQDLQLFVFELRVQT